jgi:hypothetical protein
VSESYATGVVVGVGIVSIPRLGAAVMRSSGTWYTIRGPSKSSNIAKKTDDMCIILSLNTVVILRFRMDRTSALFENGDVRDWLEVNEIRTISAGLGRYKGGFRRYETV